MNIAARRVGMLGALLSLVAACSGETVLGVTDGATDAPEGAAEHADRPDGDVRDDDRAAAEDRVEEADGPSPVCGNGVVEPGEECDLLDLDGQTCASRHRDAEGMLRCYGCWFDESGCRWCGSGRCELGETVESCPSDCRDGCGDGVCQDAEDQFGCPADCGAVAIEAGTGSSCALLADGTVMCWGDVHHPEGADPLEATAVIQDAEAISMSGLSVVGGCELPPSVFGESHACALLAGGTVSCWGDFNRIYHPPAAVAGLNGVVALSAGTTSCSSCRGTRHDNHRDYNCAVLLDGAVRCWTVSGGCSDPLVSVPGVEEAVEVSSGGDYNCAILVDGSVECWGSQVESSVSDPGIAGAVDISVGHERACAVLRDGSLECWAGSGSPYPRDLEDVVGVSLGQDYAEGSWYDRPPTINPRQWHDCVLHSNGAVQCWGTNRYGELGDGTNVEPYSAVPVYGLTGVVAVAAGAAHTCAILEGGFAWCWGRNNVGQLGDGTTTDSNVPVQVAAW